MVPMFVTMSNTGSWGSVEMSNVVSIAVSSFSVSDAFLLFLQAAIPRTAASASDSVSMRFMAVLFMAAKIGNNLKKKVNLRLLLNR